MIEKIQAKIRISKIKREEKVGLASYSWENQIPSKPGLYWIFTNCPWSKFGELADRSAYRYIRGRLDGKPEVKNDYLDTEKKSAMKLGAYCLRSRAGSIELIDPFLCKQTADDLYCVYNGYVSGDTLGQRAREHLGPADPGTGCLHLIDTFCYHDELVKTYSWEFRYCLYEDIPGSRKNADQASIKRFLTVWEQGVRVAGNWPILCSV